MRPCRSIYATNAPLRPDRIELRSNRIRAVLVFGVTSNRGRLAQWRELRDSLRMNSYRRATELMEAEVGDELVALQPDLGVCFGFNAVATEVWRQLESPKTFDQLMAQLLAGYEVDEAQCAAELDELLARMVDQGLISCESD